MTYRADGTSVVRDTDNGTAGVALAFDPEMARRIADALNDTAGPAGGRGRIDPLTGKHVDQLNVNDPTPLTEVLGRGKYVKITAPYATALMDTPGGRQVRSLNEGSILPGDVSAGTARHLLDVGLATLVEAKSAHEAYEGAPTERHRVEMTHPDVIGPTVGRPTPGSPAADYDRDAIAAAQAAARSTGGRPVVQTTGAGEAFGAASDGADSASGRPSVNAPKADWVTHAVAQRGEDVDEATARSEAEAMTKADLVARYGGKPDQGADGQQS